MKKNLSDKSPSRVNAVKQQMQSAAQARLSRNPSPNAAVPPGLAKKSLGGTPQGPSETAKKFSGFGNSKR